MSEEMLAAANAISVPAAQSAGIEEPHPLVEMRESAIKDALISPDIDARKRAASRAAAKLRAEQEAQEAAEPPPDEDFVDDETRDQAELWAWVKENDPHRQRQYRSSRA
jgi:hypothetical protein